MVCSNEGKVFKKERKVFYLEDFCRLPYFAHESKKKVSWRLELFPVSLRSETTNVSTKSIKTDTLVPTHNTAGGALLLLLDLFFNLKLNLTLIKFSFVGASFPRI